MPSYISIQNNLESELKLTTSVSPSLKASDWGITANNVGPDLLTELYWVNRFSGISDGHTWVFTSSFNYAGVEVQFQTQLKGTLLSSDLSIQIVAGGQSSGWQTENTDLRFNGTDGNAYFLTADFTSGFIFDNVRFAISEEESKVLPNIAHVVVLMMENRSFDNLLGWVYTPGDMPKQNIPAQTPTSFTGLSGGNYSNSADGVNGGKPVEVKKGTSGGYANEVEYSQFSVPIVDPGEEFDHVTCQIFNGKKNATMSGFLTDYTSQLPGEGAAQIMETYTPDQVPVISKLARAFALSDAWYASVPSQTWPNRSFLLAGSSAGHANNDYIDYWDINTIFDILSQEDIPWMVYNNGPLPSLVKTMYRKYLFNEENFAQIDAFQAKCQAPKNASESDKLPPFTFLEPAFAVLEDYPTDESYHPPHDVRPAEKFLADIYTMLQKCEYRDDILFLVLFDEHGGCYDHVPPPSGAQPPAPNPVTTDGTDFNYDRFGVRVPAIAISSYVSPGTVFRSSSSTPYDHTSLLSTLRDWLDLGDEFNTALPSPRIAVAPTLTPVFTAPRPQPWPTITTEPYSEAPVITPDSTPLNHIQIAQLLTAIALDKGSALDKAEMELQAANLRTLGDAKQLMSKLNLK